MINVPKMINSVIDRVENIMGAGENPGFPAFCSPTMFAEAIFWCIPFTCSRTVYCVLEHCSGIIFQHCSMVLL